MYRRTQSIERYLTIEAEDVNLNALGTTHVQVMRVEVIDPVAEHAALLERLFDFDAIQRLLGSGRFRMKFDAMHAVTGPYAQAILCSGSARRPAA